MKAYKTSSHLRSILKGISWRVIATIDTIIVVLFVTCFFDTCSIESALKIGFSEFFIKLFIFYLHERIWLKILKAQAKSEKQIIYKSLTWRLVATTSTFIISGIVLEEFSNLAFYIAISELVTKFALYYLHEKLWLKLPLGRIRRYFFKKHL